MKRLGKLTSCVGLMLMIAVWSGAIAYAAPASKAATNALPVVAGLAEKADAGTAERAQEIAAGKAANASAP